MCYCFLDIAGRLEKMQQQTKKKKNNLTRDPCDIELSLVCYQRLKLVQVGRWEHNRSAWKVAKPRQDYMDTDIK